MKELKYTLIADGSSDKTLLRIIKWLLDDLYPQMPCQGTFADFRTLPNPPKNLREKISKSKEYYPADVFFIHRDAESNNVQKIDQRIQEIKQDIGETEFSKTICIVPIKMMESWLLINVEAIKKAAGNRRYKGELALPSIKNIESINQPKQLLHQLLENASGLKGRNLKKFNVDKAVHLVAEYIDDFSVLRQLKAFTAFENNVKQLMQKQID